MDMQANVSVVAKARSIGPRLAELSVLADRSGDFVAESYRILKEQRPIVFVEVHPMGLEKFGSSAKAVVDLLSPAYELEGWDFSEARFRPKLVRSFLKHRPTAGRRMADMGEFLQVAATVPRPTQLYLVGRPRG